MHQTQTDLLWRQLSRVKDGHLSEALVVDTSGAEVSLKHGMHFSPCHHIAHRLSRNWLNFHQPMFLA